MPKVITPMGPVRRPFFLFRENVTGIETVRQTKPENGPQKSRMSKLHAADSSPFLRNDLDPVVVGQPGHKELLQLQKYPFHYFSISFKIGRVTASIISGIFFAKKCPVFTFDCKYGFNLDGIYVSCNHKRKIGNALLG